MELTHDEALLLDTLLGSIVDKAVYVGESSLQLKQTLYFEKTHLDIIENIRKKLGGGPNMKFKPTPVVKWIDGEKWAFIGGKARVPGTSMIVTLEELKEAQNECRTRM